MATLPPGTLVTVLPAESAKLRHQPPSDQVVVVAVHAGALLAGERSRLTQLISIDDDSVGWVGALDERMLRKVGEGPRGARSLLWSQLGVGRRLWEVVRPGSLVTPEVRTQLFTVYAGDRPWVVVGELEGGQLVGAPLNEPSNPKWWTPILTPNQLEFANSKSSQVELAHLWSLPADSRGIGRVINGGAHTLSEVLDRYL
jgi:hypothetical protein